jgi:hypothetical protein
LIVESGNLSNEANRLGLVASVLADLRYDAIGVGETDLRISGNAFFEETAKNKLTVLDASPGAPKTTLPYLVKNIDGVKVGVVSFGAEPPAANRNEYVRRKALYTAFKAARGACDILVVLDQANLITRGWVERNGQRLGAPDVVIGGSQRASTPQDEVIGRTHIMASSIQGRHVGVLDIEVPAGQEPKFKSQRISLEESVVEDEAVSKRVKTFMGTLAQASTRAPNIHVSPASTPGAKPYYPSQVCKTCHAKEYDDWKTTKHSVALNTLTSQNRAIPECLKCHAEQFRRLQRVSLTPSEGGGVECATCHMGALPHGMERKNVTAKTKVDTKSCMECHDKQWSPNYEEKSYLARVSHTAGAAGPTASMAAPPPPPAIK